MSMMTGAEALIRALEHEGVEVAFGVPGGAILPAYDPCSPARSVTYSPATSRVPGTWPRDMPGPPAGWGCASPPPGPGAPPTSSHPLADALVDSVPIVAITGQVATSSVGNDAFQEAYTTGITMPATKHNYFVTDPHEIPVVHEAFHIASTGRPGPVLIDIPKDILNAPPPGQEPGDLVLPGYKPTVDGHVAGREAADLIDGRAPGPLRRWRDHQGRAAAQLRSLAERTATPSRPP
jgi:acetolactate synthase I/II/III large subunit